MLSSRSRNHRILSLSPTLILLSLEIVVMPVDRELAFEVLKWKDPSLYRIYCRLRYRGMTDEEITRDHVNFYKLQLFELMNQELDKLEAEGAIEILNDYSDEQILLGRNRQFQHAQE